VDHVGDFFEEGIFLSKIPSVLKTRRMREDGRKEGSAGNAAEVYDIGSSPAIGL
jgi:hypothetical protein